MPSVELAERIAQRIWRNASRLQNPAERVKATRRAENIIALARIRERLNATEAEREPDVATSPA
jgi:hypothetical protein